MVNSISIRNLALDANIIAEGTTSLKRSIGAISCTLQSLPFRLQSTYPSADQTNEASNSLQSSVTLEPDGKQIRCLDQSPPAQPATLLELSSNFYPEQYTNSTRLQPAAETILHD